MRVLLPDGEVDTSDEWTVAAGDFEPLLRPERGLPLERERQRDGESIETGKEDSAAEEPEEEIEASGEVNAHFEGLRDVDGREVAVIALEGEIESIRRLEGSSDHEHGSSSFSHESEYSIELRGECLWEIAGGHLHALSLEFEFTAEIRAESVFEMPRHNFESESESESEGESSLVVSFERVD